MEGAESFGKISQQEDAAIGFRNQLAGFEASRNNELFPNISAAIFGFAQYITKGSEGVLEAVRKMENYRLEKEAAKLHEFNLANAAVLHRYAEILDMYPESAKSLEDTFPWLRGIYEWGDRHVLKTATS